MALTSRLLPLSVLLALLALTLALAAAAAPAPQQRAAAFTSTLPPNPQVQALVDSVSAGRLEESVLTLAGFTTRHTTSDTASSTTGVGAARRWVKDQLDTYSAANGGVLATGYFDWQETVCGNAGTFRNVLAQQTGALEPDRFFMVGAHLDSRTVDVCNAVAPSPAADDDGSGCAAVLELAYLIGKLPIESSMLFSTFTGEEQGLFGSDAFADAALAAGMDIAGFITNDTIGNIEDIHGAQDSTSCRSFSGPPATSSSRQLARYIKLRGEAYQPGFTVRLIPLLDRQGRGGDHIPFYNNGYAAARLIETLENGDGTGTNGHQHNGTDLPEFMNFPYLQRVCRVNLAAIASVLLAPPPPAGAAAVDAGNGSEVFVSWTASGAADLAGYRVAFRFEEGDSLFYQDIQDAGLATSYTLGGLTQGVPILVSVSAYDTDFNESVFGEEQRVVPAVVPGVPAGFQATSHAARVDLDWLPNSELDIAGYNLYRSTAAGGPFTLLEFLPHPQTHFEDTTPASGTFYYYTLTAVDQTVIESVAAGPVKGRLVDHARDILVVDASPDGLGGFFPPDAPIDLFYEGMLSDFAVDREWDRADSVAAGVELSDADLGAHHTVVYHVDSSPTTVDSQTDTMALRKYVQQGGKLLISGSRASFTLGGSTATVPVAWEPGDFMHDVMRATETRQAQEFDFAGAFGQLAGYPDLDVDGSKIFLDRLPNQDGYTGPVAGLPATEVLYHYQSLTGSGPNHDLPDAVRVLEPGFRLVAFAFPLYFMDSLSVRQTVATAIADLNAGTTGVGGSEGDGGDGVGGDGGAHGPGPPAALRFELGTATPNPFNPSTRIGYATDRAEHLALAIYDAQGRLVETLFAGRVEPGRYTIDWRGRSARGDAVGSGVYFVELEGRESGRRTRRKLVLLR